MKLSVVEHLPCLCKALGFIHDPVKYIISTAASTVKAITNNDDDIKQWEYKTN